MYRSVMETCGEVSNRVRSRNNKRIKNKQLKDDGAIAGVSKHRNTVVWKPVISSRSLIKL